MLKHIMLDCESLGLKFDSVITTIGAVEFDPYSKRIGNKFHVAINPDSAQQYGLNIQGSAVVWWLRQSQAARDALIAKLDGESKSLPLAMSSFHNFISQHGVPNDIKVWSCGMMDIIWTTTAFNAVSQPVPWGYRVADYRTLRDEFGMPEDTPPKGTEHDALSDALWQAQYLQNMYARLGKTA